MRRTLIPLLLLLLASACLSTAPIPLASPTAPVAHTSSPRVEPTAESTPATVSDEQPLAAYRATLVLHFQGTYSWTYQLESRTDGHIMAYDLHIEGVDPPQNLGDVRVVIDGDGAKMRGPATEDACVQFPSDFDLERSFLSPDELLPPEQVDDALRVAGEDVIAGRDSTHLALRQPEMAGWQNVEVDVWKDGATGVVLRYDLRLIGPDPLFDAGQGTLVGQFVVVDVGPQVIEPITGCEIALPLPLNATQLVSMPGLISFESTSTTEQMVAFYQNALPEEGWAPTSEPQQGVDAVLLTYRRDGQTLDINIETDEEGVRVELLLSDP
jgi:hypothetical protein